MDRFIKYGKFTSTNESHSAKDFADIVVREVISNHRLSNKFMIDRNTTFASKFFIALTAKLGVNNKFSTAFHPQTDGQIERFN